jgi:aminopeptidase N
LSGRGGRLALALALALLGADVDAKPFSDLDRLPGVARSRTVDLVTTRFDVTLDFDAAAIAGTSTLVVAGLPRPARVLEIDAVAMEIRGVRDADSGAALKYDYDGERITVPLDPPLKEGLRRSVTIDYRARPTAGLFFVRPSPRRPKGHREAWTQGEEEDTRRWLPSIDRLDDFGTVEATVTVPRGLKVLANGRLIAEEPQGDQVRWRWRQDIPHATYLTFVAAGPFEVLRDTWRELPVSFWVLPWQRGQAAHSLAPTFAALDFFADVMGLRYPWDKYDQIAVSDYPMGGMENTSATLLNGDALHDKDAEPDYASTDLIVHELAHQWFGDVVTCRSWAHAWLNEGFASYAEALFREHQDGVDEATARFLAELASVADEQTAYRRPIVTSAYDEPKDMFDAHSYAKGAWVLHALRGWIADDAVFYRGLREWVTRHAHQPVESAQLQRVFEDVSGADLERFFTQWLLRPGLPEVEVGLDWRAEAGALAVSFRQTQPREGGVPSYVLPMDLRLADDAGGAILTQRVWIDRAEQQIIVPMLERPAFVEVDPRGWTPGTVRVLYGREDALAALAHGGTALSRRRAILALAEMRGDQGVAEALAAAPAADHWGVAQDAIEAIANLGVEDTTALLLRFEHHPAPRARAALAKTLGTLPPDAAGTAALERLLIDPAQRVVAAAARAYPAVATGSGAVKRLAKVARRGSPWEVVAMAALSAIGKLGGEDALEAAAARVGTKEHPRVRAAALEAVGHAAHGRPKLAPAARRAIASSLDDPTAGVRLGAIAGLEQVGDAAALDLIRKRLAREGSAEVRGRGATAVEVLRALQRDACSVGRLEQRLDDVDQEQSATRDALERLQRRLEAIESRP